MDDTVFQSARKYKLQFAGEENRDLLGNNFRWGTLVGDLSYRKHYRQWPVPVLLINTVRNEEPKNGQFRQFLTHLIACCAEQHRDLVALNVIPASLATYLMEEWQFQQVPTVPGLVRRCAPGTLPPPGGL